MAKRDIEIILKVTEDKGLILNRTYILFGKPRQAIGLWNNSVVFATDDPQTLSDCQVLIYTIDELKEFYESHNFGGLIDLED